MSESVRPAVLVAPGRYEVQEFPRPTLPDGAALVRMEMSGICGTDKHTFAGETKQYAGTPAESDTPFRITHCPDVVCGRCYPCTHVQGYVWCDRSQCYGNSFTSAEAPHLLGGWAEYLYLRPDTLVYKVPSRLSPRVAVLAELMACAASLDKLKEFSSYALEGFNSGDTVMVIGAGPLGLLHVAKADMMGAGQIIASDLSAYRLDWARRCGADETLDVTATSSAERIERVRERDRWTRRG